ncbi:MAG: dienelactone hydrolase family protein [Chitinophagaceae bacterium]
MKIGFNFLLAFAITNVAIFFSSCNTATTEENKMSEPKIKTADITYKVDSLNVKAFAAYDENLPGKRPGILVVPEWWGVTDYTKNRAKQLAGMGYYAMVVDMYGNGKTGDDPKAAAALAMPYYINPVLCKTRLDAALAKLRSMPETDAVNVAAIGYCFGGFVVLNAAKQGIDLKGIVSFHGGLGGVAPDKDLLKAAILVCHGEADSFVPQQEVDAFKKGMDSIKKEYTFKSYPNATHAFTNPAATETGKKFSMPITYNAAADTASWNDMKDFFNKIFVVGK